MDYEKDDRGMPHCCPRCHASLIYDIETGYYICRKKCGYYEYKVIK